MGRPRGSKLKNGQSKRVEIIMPTAVYDRLKYTAEQEDTSMSWIVTAALKAVLNIDKEELGESPPKTRTERRERRRRLKR